MDGRCLKCPTDQRKIEVGPSHHLTNISTRQTRIGSESFPYFWAVVLCVLECIDLQLRWGKRRVFLQTLAPQSFIGHVQIISIKPPTRQRKKMLKLQEYEIPSNLIHIK